MSTEFEKRQAEEKELYRIASTLKPDCGFCHRNGADPKILNLEIAAEMMRGLDRLEATRMVKKDYFIRNAYSRHSKDEPNEHIKPDSYDDDPETYNSLTDDIIIKSKMPCYQDCIDILDEDEKKLFAKMRQKTKELNWRNDQWNFGVLRRHMNEEEQILCTKIREKIVMHFKEYFEK